MIVYVFGDFEYKAAVYSTALAINFFTHALAFVIALEVILNQPTDVTQEKR